MKPKIIDLNFFFDTSSKLMGIPATKWIELYINIIILSHVVINEHHSVFVPDTTGHKVALPQEVDTADPSVHEASN